MTSTAHNMAPVYGANYFQYQGMNYLVIVDRYSNWPTVDRAQDGSKGLTGCYEG